MRDLVANCRLLGYWPACCSLVSDIRCWCLFSCLKFDLISKSATASPDRIFVMSTVISYKMQFCNCSPFFQEDEATKTDHAWCASTLKRLREVSPLSLKVSLRSVSSFYSFFICQPPPPTKKRKERKKSETHLLPPFATNKYIHQIREGRYQTLDECLIREYRMSLQGISGGISNDFCEVSDC